MLAALRWTRRADESQPVRVAGDPEQSELAVRTRDSIPLSEELCPTLCGLGEAVGVPGLLDR